MHTSTPSPKQAVGVQGTCLPAGLHPHLDDAQHEEHVGRELLDTHLLDGGVGVKGVHPGAGGGGRARGVGGRRQIDGQQGRRGLGGQGRTAESR